MTTAKFRNMTSIYLICQDQILLLYRQGSRAISDSWIGAAGGHMEKEELNDPKACVLRELEEEIGITEDLLENLQLRYVTMRRKGGEIRQNHYFFAELKNGKDMDLCSNEGVLKWFPVEETKTLDMPFSAKFMMEHYLETGRYDEKMYVGVSDGIRTNFQELVEN